MNTLRLLLLPICAVLFCSCATAPAHKTAGVSKTMTVRTTAYTANEPGGPHAANGTRLHYGGTTYSAAADWSWLPLGTRFKMKETGRTYVVEDYGSALVGKHTIDLFMPSNSAMREWGVRNVNIDILEWGSRAMSLKMLEPRQKAGFVRNMVVSLKKPAPSILLAQD
jgi:3D (Asp-Asp-Asp) domain-containing protein